MRILTLGPKGTFSEVACENYIKKSKINYEVVFYASFFDVINNLKESDIAILAFENSTDGFIQQTLDLIYYHNLHIVNTINVDVHYQFVSNNPVDSNEALYVQFTAVNQTSKFIYNNRLYTQVLTESNTDSLLKLKESNKGQAIIPSHIKTNYKYVYNNVEDNSNNKTRFVVLSKKGNKVTDTISKAGIFVLFNKDKSGMLYDLLSFFKLHDINITAILSRPYRKRNGAYYFFLELDIHDEKILELIKTFSEANDNYDIKIAGLY